MSFMLSISFFVESGESRDRLQKLSPRQQGVLGHQLAQAAHVVPPVHADGTDDAVAGRWMKSCSLSFGGLASAVSPRVGAPSTCRFVPY
jgi:hypothetical protein